MDGDLLLLPFQFSFMQRAFLIAFIVAVPAALLSCFLVVKGWALMGDAISHAVLPGVVLAYVLGAPLIIGAFVAGMVCAVATGYFTQNSRVKPDTVMGVVFSGMFGFGLVIYVAIDTDIHLNHILFGHMLGVEREDILISAGIALVVTMGLVLTWKDVMVWCFDAIQARTLGLSIPMLHYGLLAAMTLTIVATLSATGLILAIGLMIAPGAIAFLLVKRFAVMMVVAVVVSISAMGIGVYASFFLDSAPAPTVILVFTLMFFAAFMMRLFRQHHVEQVTVEADERGHI